MHWPPNRARLSFLRCDVRVAVPESVRFHFTGALQSGVTAKDVMLHLLSQPFWRSGEGIGKVLEFSGPALKDMPFDERSTLTNMAVEAGGFTGIIEADETVVDYLVTQRGMSADQVRALVVRADPDAEYAHSFDVDLGTVQTMVATPGDPRNGVPLSKLGDTHGEVKIDIAYGGSCTGGKKADMDCTPRCCSERSTKDSRSRTACSSTFSSAHNKSASTPKNKATSTPSAPRACRWSTRRAAPASRRVPVSRSRRMR